MEDKVTNDKIKIKFITNRKLSQMPLEKKVEKVLERFSDDENNEIESIVLREKDLSLEEYRELYFKVREVTRKYKIKLFIHSFFELLPEVYRENQKEALLHLPYPKFLEIMDCDKENDFCPSQSKKIITSKMINMEDEYKNEIENGAKMEDEGDKIYNFFSQIGVSVHSVREGQNVEEILSKKLSAKANLPRAYVTISNIFETQCKKGKKGTGLGIIEDLQSQLKTVKIYPLGGIDFDKVILFEKLLSEKKIDGLGMMSCLIK